MECLLITGQAADYQLKVVVKDMDAYQALLLNRITRIEGITGVHSSFVLRRVIEQDGAADRRDLVAVTSWSSVAPAQQEAARIDGAGQIFGDG
jgi:DNA-binding Lrp family transcriptional regulator